MRGADVVAQTLAEAGTETVFSLSGNQIMVLYDACLDHGPRLVHTRHEAAAVFMAEGHAQITGQPGVALVTAGAGLGNAVAPLLTASASQTPVVLLSGDSPVSKDGQGAFQEMSQTAITASATKWSHRVAETADLAETLREAFRVASAGQPGPVHLSLPVDVLQGPAQPPAPQVQDALPDADPSELLRALQGAERPLILLGPALARGRALPDLGVPVLGMESPRGANDPALGNVKAAWAEADLVIALGKPVDFTLGFGAQETWPNARWITVHGDAAEVARAKRNLGTRALVTQQACPAALLRALAAQPLATQRWSDWRAHVDTLRAARLTDGPEGLTSITLCQGVQTHLERLGKDAVVVCDGGEFGQWAQALTRAPRRVMNGVSGAIGGGIGYAMGARAADPAAQVVALMGDGTAGFHFMEFETALREDLPFVAVIGNDQRWNAEHEIQRRNFGEARQHGCLLSGARYDRAAAAMGGFGAHVTTLAELDQALQEASASGLPACVNVEMTGLPAPSF